MARVAFTTFAVMKQPYGHDEVRGFEDRTPIVFEAAEHSPGFITRAKEIDDKTELTNFERDWGEWGEFCVPRFYTGGRTTDTDSRAGTLSLWTDLESVCQFSYSGLHREALQLRQKWFVKPEWPTYAIWWVPDDYIPTWAEACRKLEHLHDHGPTPEAFDFKNPFDENGNPVDPKRLFKRPAWAAAGRMTMPNDETFIRHESNVRSYCRSFPAVLAKASGHLVYAEDGSEYIDFFAGAGSLNYGHNNAEIKQPVVDYLLADGVIHSLDLYTVAKRRFIADFVQYILEPRGLNYKLQFPGPTGTNAVEAALKLARKVTKRWNIIAFSNAFHGMTLGSLAATTNPRKRAGSGVALSGVTPMPFDGFIGPDVSSLTYIEKMLTTPGSGVELPAGFLVEVVQGEGGLNVASVEWLRGLHALARQLQAPLIVDDIQAGCGRTGRFFSFEEYGIAPDIVCLSKSLSGLGLPLSLVLLKPELDVWSPGEHNGTFRGNNLGFVGASAAIHAYWKDSRLQDAVAHKSRLIVRALEDIVALFPPGEACVKGKGMIVGVSIAHEGFADAVSQKAFAHGLIVETCGVNDQVVKLLPPLTISEDGLKRGLDILAQSFREVLAERPGAPLAEPVGHLHGVPA